MDMIVIRKITGWSACGQKSDFFGGQGPNNTNRSLVHDANISTVQRLSTRGVGRRDTCGVVDGWDRDPVMRKTVEDEKLGEGTLEFSRMAMTTMPYLRCAGAQYS